MYILIYTKYDKKQILKYTYTKRNCIENVLRKCCPDKWKSPDGGIETVEHETLPIYIFWGSWYFGIRYRNGNFRS